MLAEWTVELAADDPRLEIPWVAEDGHVRYFDLKRQPELLLEIPEACTYPELAEFLSWANEHESRLETAKCDAWISRELNLEDEVFGEACKFSSYIDLLLTSASREQLADNEKFVRELVGLLRHAPEMSSAVELIVRRCVDHRDNQDASECFYITFY
ncbi:MAG TPA: hypothetical protein VG498_17145, partial [Terriglobales bacterium]|nr:hypothetical protein [Terriglobales bacterium]